MTRRRQPSRLAQIFSAIKGLVSFAVALVILARTFADMRRPGQQKQKEDAAASEPVGRPGDGEVESPGRRRLLELLGLGAAGAGAAVVGLPITIFIVAPVVQEEDPVWREVGTVDSFRMNETVKVVFLDSSPVPWSGPAAMSAAWLRRTGEGDFQAFKVICTHLGCAVRWEPGPRFFMCPCHGGVFLEDGSVAAGPPQEPLHRYSVRVRDGIVELMTGPIPITGDLLEEGPG